MLVKKTCRWPTTICWTSRVKKYSREIYFLWWVHLLRQTNNSVFLILFRISFIHAVERLVERQACPLPKTFRIRSYENVTTVHVLVYHWYVPLRKQWHHLWDLAKSFGFKGQCLGQRSWSLTLHFLFFQWDISVDMWWVERGGAFCLIDSGRIYGSILNQSGQFQLYWIRIWRVSVF